MSINLLIESRAKKLGYKTVESFLENCAPNFDIEKTIEKHKQMETILPNMYKIETDEEIHELVCLLNKYKPTTTMSCQCDFYGYANINFTLTGFKYVTDMLFDCAKTYIKNLLPNLPDDKILDLVFELDIIKRFIFDIGSPVINKDTEDKTNKISMCCYMNYEENKLCQSIRWQFLTTDIIKITSQVKAIMNE